MQIYHVAALVGSLSLVACSAQTSPPSPPQVNASDDANGDKTTSNEGTRPVTPTATTPATSTSASSSTTDSTPLPQPAQTPPPPNDTCVGTMSGGSSFKADGVSLDDCTTECNNNAAANPNQTVTCTWNGQPVTITSVGECVQLYSGGGSMDTKGISQDGCVQSCGTNRASNPNQTITCSWNGQSF